MKNLTLLLLALLLFACSESPSSTASSELDHLSFTTLDGKTVSLTDFRGQPVLLNFWATWCKPCVYEMPSIEKSWRELKDQGYVFLAASYEPPAVIQQFQTRSPYSFSFVQLNGTFDQMGISSIPTTYLIDKNGNIAHKEVGAGNWNDIQHLELLKKIQN